MQYRKSFMEKGLLKLFHASIARLSCRCEDEMARLRATGACKEDNLPASSRAFLGQ
jgi:hypothetical protein